MIEQQNPLDKEFSAEEAAKYLKTLNITESEVHPETIRKWLREGRLKGHKDGSLRGRGGSWRVTLGELLAFDPGRSGGRRGRPRRTPL
jgi:xanthine dehydrogenase iron-sulfur cluster and FAD-binding subunit A